MADWRSALQGVAKPGAGSAESAAAELSSPGILVAEKPCRGLVQVAAWADSLAEASAILGRVTGLNVPQPTGATASDARLKILCVGPGRWLVDGSGEIQANLRQALTIEVAALTDLGHAFTLLRVSGPRVLALLAKGPAIDFECAFPPGSVARSTIQHIGVTIYRPAAEDFELYVYRGFARSLRDWVLDAAAEFGARVEIG